MAIDVTTLEDWNSIEGLRRLVTFHIAEADTYREIAERAPHEWLTMRLKDTHRALEGQNDRRRFVQLRHTAKVLQWELNKLREPDHP